MSTRCAGTSILLVLCTLTACTATPPRMGTTSASRVYVTGSLIAAPVDSVTGQPAPNPALQVVTQDEIMVTGRTNLGTALHLLVPSIQ
jgi:hypothetical protein